MFWYKAINTIEEFILITSDTKFLASIGQFLDDDSWVVSHKSLPFFPLNTSLKFKTSYECIKYVEGIIRNSMDNISSSKTEIYFRIQNISVYLKKI